MIKMENNINELRNLIIKKDVSIDKLCTIISENPIIQGKIFIELFNNETNGEIKKQLKVICLHLIDLTEFVQDTNYNLKFDKNKIEEILKMIEKRLSKM
jgi:hypothetical protein